MATIDPRTVRTVEAPSSSWEDLCSPHGTFDPAADAFLFDRGEEALNRATLERAARDLDRLDRGLSRMQQRREEAKGRLAHLQEANTTSALSDPRFSRRLLEEGAQGEMSIRHEIEWMDAELADLKHERLAVEDKQQRELDRAADVVLRAARCDVSAPEVSPEVAYALGSWYARYGDGVTASRYLQEGALIVEDGVASLDWERQALLAAPIGNDLLRSADLDDLNLRFARLSSVHPEFKRELEADLAHIRFRVAASSITGKDFEEGGDPLARDYQRFVHQVQWRQRRIAPTQEGLVEAKAWMAGFLTVAHHRAQMGMISNREGRLDGHRRGNETLLALADDLASSFVGKMGSNAETEQYGPRSEHPGVIDLFEDLARLHGEVVFTTELTANRPVDAVKVFVRERERFASSRSLAAFEKRMTTALPMLGDGRGRFKPVDHFSADDQRAARRAYADFVGSSPMVVSWGLPMAGFVAGAKLGTVVGGPWGGVLGGGAGVVAGLGGSWLYDDVTSNEEQLQAYRTGYARLSSDDAERVFDAMQTNATQAFFFSAGLGGLSRWLSVPAAAPVAAGVLQSSVTVAKNIGRLYNDTVSRPLVYSALGTFGAIEYFALDDDGFGFDGFTSPFGLMSAAIFLNRVIPQPVFGIRPEGQDMGFTISTGINVWNQMQTGASFRHVDWNRPFTADYVTSLLTLHYFMSQKFGAQHLERSALGRATLRGIDAVDRHVLGGSMARSSWLRPVVRIPGATRGIVNGDPFRHRMAMRGNLALTARMVPVVVAIPFIKSEAQGVNPWTTAATRGVGNAVYNVMVTPIQSVMGDDSVAGMVVATVGRNAIKMALSWESNPFTGQNLYFPDVYDAMSTGVARGGLDVDACRDLHDRIAAGTSTPRMLSFTERSFDDESVQNFVRFAQSHDAPFREVLSQCAEDLDLADRTSALMLAGAGDQRLPAEFPAASEPEIP
ncbi:MAG: hypothetical protein HY465_04225 [Deltaproteobacteria bacterium]|nr:hypothetical protein [Deltaproteobacteria bacterium]